MTFSWLEQEVIDSGYCRLCGACAAACKPGVIEVDEAPELVGSCVECGLCRDVCPADNDTDSLGIGELDRKSVYSAKTLDQEIADECQDGGAVTTILASLLDEQVIDAAVVVGQTDTWEPIPIIVSSPEEVLESSGTKFGSAPILTRVREASKQGEIAVVGTPCQIEAARILDQRGVGEIKYFIGVFCMKNYRYKDLFDEITSRADCNATDINKIGINKGKFSYKAGGQENKLDLSEINHCVRPVCHECSDFEASYADISVGSVGSSKDRSTVVVRSEPGREILKKSGKQLDIDRGCSEDSVDRLCKIKRKR